MRLQSILPPLPASTIDALQAIGIRTDVDLLFKNGSAFDIWRRLNIACSNEQERVQLPSLEELARFMERTTECAAAPAIGADRLLVRQLAKESYELSTGLPALDCLLDGFGDNRVIEISGDKGSGKTALALQIVLQHLCRYSDSSVTWIDTTGDFSSERSADMLRNMDDSPGKATALDRLLISLAFDAPSAYDVLESLPLKSDDTTLRCIVVDPITPLLGPALSNITSAGHAQMVTFMRGLTALSRKHDLSVLVLNNTTALPAGKQNPLSVFADTNRKPALGPSFTFLTDATLWLARRPKGDGSGGSTVVDPEQRTAEVFRSKKTKSKTWCTFRIRAGTLVA